MKSSHELSLEIAELEKKLQQGIKDRGEVLKQKHLLARQILTLECQKSDLEPGLRKARENLELIRSELRVLKDSFWATKGENR